MSFHYWIVHTLKTCLEYMQDVALQALYFDSNNVLQIPSFLSCLHEKVTCDIFQRSIKKPKSLGSHRKSALVQLCL